MKDSPHSIITKKFKSTVNRRENIILYFGMQVTAGTSLRCVFKSLGKDDLHKKQKASWKIYMTSGCLHNKLPMPFQKKDSFWNIFIGMQIRINIFVGNITIPNASSFAFYHFQWNQHRKTLSAIWITATVKIEQQSLYQTPTICNSGIANMRNK